MHDVNADEVLSYLFHKGTKDLQSERSGIRGARTRAKEHESIREACVRVKDKTVKLEFMAKNVLFEG